MPAEQPRLGRGDLCRDLFEILVWMMLGEELVPAPCCAGAGIKPQRFECIASIARSGDTFYTTSARDSRNIHHTTQLPISFADAYQLLVFHVLPPFGRGTREAADRPRSLVTLVVWGRRTTKQKGGSRRPRVIWLSCWG